MPDLDYGGRDYATPDAATPALCPDANFTIAVSAPDANERSTCGGCSDGGVSTFLANDDDDDEDDDDDGDGDGGGGDARKLTGRAARVVDIDAKQRKKERPQTM